MLDRVNALDLTWHFSQEFPAPAFGWDEIRRPFWMLKFLYDMGNVWTALAELPRVVLEPGRLAAREAGVPAAALGSPLLNPLTNSSTAPSSRASAATESPFWQVGGPRRGRPLHAAQRHEALRAGRLRPQPDRQQPGGRALPRHDAAGSSSRSTTSTSASPATTAPTTPRSARAGDPPTRSNQRMRSTSADPQLDAASSRPSIHRLRAHHRHVGELLRRGVHADRLPHRDHLRHRHPVLRHRKDGVIDDPGAPGRHQEGHVEGHDRLRSPDVDPVLNKKTTFFLTGQFFWHHLVDNPTASPSRSRSLPARRRPAAGRVVPDRRARPPVERSRRGRHGTAARRSATRSATGSRSSRSRPSRSTAAAASCPCSAWRSTR